MKSGEDSTRKRRCAPLLVPFNADVRWHIDNADRVYLRPKSEHCR